jgi:adenylosuccinate lyase
VHCFLTSYDVLGTGAVLHYLDAHRNVVMPAVTGVIIDLVELVRKYADLVQIGRTHGQHALPITVGFWLATILDRVVTNVVRLDELASNLTGKISGPVGASNAVETLGIAARCGGDTFERRVLRELGLEPSPISTQILPPESVAYYLHAAVLLSAALGQLGLDCRQLARTEIAEITQLDGSSSSAMAHKTVNPITYENTQGMSLLSRNAYGLVFDCLQSEHQRDLVGSSLMRSWPAVIVYLQEQLDSLQNKRNGQTFLQRLTVNAERCKANLALKADVLAAEMVYIALLMAGYPGDAHAVVNKRLVPYATSMNCHLLDALDEAAIEDSAVGDAFARVPADLRERLRHPEQLVGNSAERALATAARAEAAVQAWLPR